MNKKNSRIGSIILPYDFKIVVEKFESFRITICNDKGDLYNKFTRLKNHYRKVVIKHEKLDYSGYAKICDTYKSESATDVIIFLSFEA